jgi:hypothetical protein
MTEPVGKGRFKTIFQITKNLILLGAFCEPIFHLIA